MSSEMISGPDLGGGYLHQLTLDRGETATTFTFHAQDGGADANGPPIGSLGPLGFVHPPTPCPFGGPRCWQRRFLAPFADAAKVRQAYNRFRFTLDATLRQRYAGLAVAAEPALAEVLGRLAPPEVRFHIGGSMAARLLGADVAVADLDLATDRPGVDRIGDRLAPYLIEPIASTDWPTRGIVRAGRAFVGTLGEGARAEWAVPLDGMPAPALDEWTVGPDGARCLEAAFGGGTVRVSRPEYALVRATEQGRGERRAPLLQLVRRLGPDRELLGVLLDRSTLEPASARELRRDVDA
jgi:hypothetical protein